MPLRSVAENLHIVTQSLLTATIRSVRSVMIVGAVEGSARVKDRLLRETLRFVAPDH